MLFQRAFSKMADKAESISGPISSAIRSKLHAALNPSHFNLVNDSHKHSGHWQDDGSQASTAKETHLRLEVVSDSFAGLNPVKRHQLVYGLLKEELAEGLHALSMTLKTQSEAQKSE